MFTYLLEGADRIGGQLRGDKECPFSDVTKSGRVWRKVPEGDARSERVVFTSCLLSPIMFSLTPPFRFLVRLGAGIL